jgi:predicted RNA binding protein YcfA (HicA-like mRNA interferase family)
MFLTSVPEGSGVVQLSTCLYNMSGLPIISGKKAVRTFSKFGFSPSRQTASHIIMEKAGLDVTLSVPLHNELKRGTLRNLIKDAGITVEEFVAML